MNIENQINERKLRPLTRFIYTIGELPTSYLMSMTYEEQLMWLSNFLEKTVIPTLDNTTLAVKELQEYVNNYFDNLDIQDEVDNKIDELVDDGTLAEIITSYLEVKGILGFYRKADLKAATNLIDGSIAKTLGNSIYNDGYGSFYRIRELQNTDVIDDDNLVALTNYPTLVAEKIINGEIGNLSNLTTTAKTNVVSAINEINSRTNDHQYLYGIIRPTSEGWAILNDSSHTPVNLDSVTINDGNLIITHNHNFTKVNSFQITSDETFSKYGITAGASVGLNSSRIEIFQNLHAGGFIRTNTGTPVIQTDYSNLIDSVSFSTNHLIVVFNQDLTGCSPNDWEVKFAGAGVLEVVQGSKAKYVVASLVNNRRLDIYCLLSDNSFSTDITDFDRIIVTMNYCHKINPQDLVTNPISGANFWIEGIFE